MDSDTTTSAQAASRLATLADEARDLTAALKEATEHLDWLAEIGASLERDSHGDRLSS